MLATWQCASINPGTTVAPPSRTTRAPAAATARTSSTEPTAAIRSSRNSMLSAAGPPPAAMVTHTASSTISSISQPPQQSVSLTERPVRGVPKGQPQKGGPLVQEQHPSGDLIAADPRCSRTIPRASVDRLRATGSHTGPLSRLVKYPNGPFEQRPNHAPDVTGVKV